MTSSVGKVFLSHSSSDKTLVAEVYRLLGDRLAEYDAQTFEGGLPNWHVIVRAFERCDVFALIATAAALDSNWVKREVEEARRRIRDSRLKRFLIFVADGTPLKELPRALRDFAIFLKFSKPRSIERAIQRHLLEISGARRAGDGAFVGRDKELGEIKELLLNPVQPIAGICVSGLPLQGRAALIKRVMQDINPSLHQLPSAIDFHVYESCADLALSIYGSMHELIGADEIAQIRARFQLDDSATCGKRLFELVKEASDDRLYPVFSDRGGILNHDGALSPIAQGLIDAATEGHDIRVFFVTTRRPVPKVRLSTERMVFYDLRPMSDQAARQYVVHHARARRLLLNPEQVEAVVRAARGQVPVLEFILEKCLQYPPEHALADLTDAQDVTRERATAFLQGVELSDNAARFLGVLNNYFNVPAEFVGTIFDNFEEGAQASRELLDQHIVIETQGIYSISPPLVDAISRDPRFVLGDNAAGYIAKAFAKLFTEYSEEGIVPVSLIDAGSIASIEAGTSDSAWANQFILPSHYIYLARRSYDRRHYQRAIEFCEAAIAYRNALTNSAYIYVCRTLGMSAARLDAEELVKRSVILLNDVRDRLARSYAAYVRGFSYRLLGKFVDAEKEYEEALKNMKNDVSLMRELALVNLLRRQFRKAIDYGERALSYAATSPYILDIVARAKIANAHDPLSLEYDSEIIDLMRRLYRSCEGKALSFYDIRSAELNLALHRYPDAINFADEAVRKTPDLAAPYLMRARIHLAQGLVRQARSDRDQAKQRTKAAIGRHRYFDSEILRLELEIAIKSRSWPEAVSLHNQFAQFRSIDAADFAALIAAGIDSRTDTLASNVRQFATDHRRVRPRAET